MGQLGESDDVRVLVASTAPRWLTPEAVAAKAENVARLKVQLHELKPTLASVDMPRCLQEAAQAEGAAGSRRVITVFTDRQAYGWRTGSRPGLAGGEAGDAVAGSAGGAECRDRRR